MFKVGAKVRCVDSSGRPDLKKDSIYTVEEMDKAYDAVIVNGTFYFRKRFELVEENMFKVGDKVRCINNSGRAELRKDAIYTTEIPDEFYISLKGFTGKFFSQDRFELVEENMFKVGDKVRCIDAAGYVEVGQEYVVLEIVNDNIRILVNKGLKYLYESKLFELVTKPEKSIDELVKEAYNKGYQKAIENFKMLVERL